MADSYAVIRVSMLNGGPGLVQVFDNEASVDAPLSLVEKLTARDTGDFFKFIVVALTKRDGNLP